MGLAAQAIATNNAEIVLAGGMESMSNCPYLAPQARQGLRLGHGRLLDSMITDGLWDVYEDFHMGMTGELVAEKYGITRERQDQYAVESHRRAIEAAKKGRFTEEIVPVAIPQKKGEPLQFAVDESPRAERHNVVRAPTSVAMRTVGQEFGAAASPHEPWRAAEASL